VRSRLESFWFTFLPLAMLAWALEIVSLVGYFGR
jgi:nitrate reductase NapE component